MLHRFIVTCSVLTLFAAMSAGLAKADSVDTSTTAAVVPSSEYDFSYVVGADTYTWSLPEPVMSTNVLAGETFNVEGISYTLNNNMPAIGDLEFYSDEFQGGFALASYPPASDQTYFIDATGPALYEPGTENSPVFNTGTFTLDDSVADATGTLTISEVSTTATPEPSTLLLTGLGIIGLFWVARQKRFTAPA